MSERDVLPPGTRVQLAIDSTDLIDVEVRATYLETLAEASGAEPLESEDEQESENLPEPVEAPPPAATA